jgi:hypothetical protein
MGGGRAGASVAGTPPATLVLCLVSGSVRLSAACWISWAPRRRRRRRRPITTWRHTTRPRSCATRFGSPPASPCRGVLPLAAPRPGGAELLAVRRAVGRPDSQGLVCGLQGRHRGGRGGPRRLHRFFPDQSAGDPAVDVGPRSASSPETRSLAAVSKTPATRARPGRHVWRSHGSFGGSSAATGGVPRLADRRTRHPGRSLPRIPSSARAAALWWRMGGSRPAGLLRSASRAGARAQHLPSCSSRRRP